MAESHELHASTPLLLGRLRLADESRLKTHFATEGYDQQTQTNVIVAREPKSTGQYLEQLTSIAHPHLVPVVAVLSHDDDLLVVSSIQNGTHLSTKVSAEGRVHAVESVRMVLRVADALSHLHDKGVFHGRVHPENVLVELPDSNHPSLIYGTRCPLAFTRPERDNWEQPLLPSDDTWATTALLYYALTATLPPRTGLADESDLDHASIDDPLLRQVLLHGLAKEPVHRAETLFAIRRELARWFIAHAADEPMPQAAVSHKPPPLPASLVPAPQSGCASGAPKSKASVPASEARPMSASVPSGKQNDKPSLRSQVSVPPQKSPWLRLTPMAVVAAIVGLSAAWGLSLLRKGTPTVVVKSSWVAAPTASSSASAGPIDLAEVPVTGEEQQTHDAITSCAKGYLREGTLVKDAKLESLCQKSELPQTLGAVRSAFAATNNPNAPMLSRFETLAWYSLPTIMGLRQACCGESVIELKLPSLGDVCPDFPPALDALAKSVSSSQSLDAAIRRYETAAQCVAKSGRAPGIAAGPPGPVSERAFRELFSIGATGAEAAANGHDASTAAAGSSSPPTGSVDKVTAPPAASAP